MMQRILILLACITIAACTDLEGTFEPDCQAFAGDRIVFTNGTFEWHKFTDERRIDEHGNAIDPFPGYPIAGSFKVTGKRVEFVAAEGTKLDDRYLVEENNGVFLLTRQEYDAVHAGNALPRCVLRLSEGKSSN